MARTPIDDSGRRIMEDAQARFGYVRWIGGGSGAGKSTVARRLADRYSLRLYSTDDVHADHIARTDPAEMPLANAFLAMDMDERWVNRSPHEMLKTFHWFHGEAFDRIVEDLLTMAEKPGMVLVEGFRLLPRRVAPLLSRASQAIWLIPTPEFRRAAFESRGFTWAIPRHTKDPERALANLLERDHLFTELVLSEARAMQLQTIEVQEGLDLEAFTTHVAKSLGLTERNP
jgi:2-phosphoglycerate kinase